MFLIFLQINLCVWHLDAGQTEITAIFSKTVKRGARRQGGEAGSKVGWQDNAKGGMCYRREGLTCVRRLYAKAGVDVTHSGCGVSTGLTAEEVSCALLHEELEGQHRELG